MNYNDVQDNNDFNNVRGTYHKHNVLRGFGIFTKIHFIITTFVSAIALLITLRYELNLEPITMVLYFGLSELFLSIAVMPSLFYLIADSDHGFSRVYYNDVHIIFSLLLAIYGVGSIITAVYLFQDYVNFLTPRYHLIQLIISLVCLVLEGLIYPRIKRMTNLSVPAITGFHSFISQIMAFTIATLIFHTMFVVVYENYWDILNTSNAIVYVLDIMNFAFALTACLLCLYFYDVIFGANFIIFGIVVAIFFRYRPGILYTTLIYIAIVFIMTIYTGGKHKRAFIGHREVVVV